MYGFFGGVFIDDPKYPELNAELEKVAEAHNISKSAASIAWILRHPANIQPIIGTTKSERVKDYATAADVTLSRPEWYAIYKAAGNIIP